MTTPPQPTAARKLRLGTRASALARWQAEWVASRLADQGVAVELVPLSTTGDREPGQSLASLGGVGVFTKELQRALLDGRIDLAVHSLKDLPTEPVAGLMLAAVPPRGPVNDVLATNKAERIDDLPAGAVVGTGSARRRAQLWHLRPDLEMRDIRGNVDTRLRKLNEGQYDALVLAQAGLERLGLASQVSCVLPASVMLPAAGQGALGIEVRADDPQVLGALRSLNDPTSHAAVSAERKLLATLRAGCLAPVGTWARIEPDEQLHLSAVVLSPDGSQKILAQHLDSPTEWERLALRVADDLLRQGAAELIGS
jgi:hydroxymethylbilane synthase